MEFFQNLTSVYWGGYGFQALFYFSLVLIAVLERKRIRRAGALWYSVMILLAVYNPVIQVVCKHIFGEESLISYYSRLFCLIPVVFVIAYAVVLVLGHISGWRKLCCTLAMLLAFAVSGHSAYGEEWFVKSSNVTKVPEDVLQLEALFEDYEGPIPIAVPTDLTTYMRQINSKFSLLHGRNQGVAFTDQLQSESPDVKMILDYVSSTGTDYLVALYNEGSLAQYLQWGCEVVGYTEQYVALKQHYPKWVLTQYADASGNQGMFYTLECVKDGALFVIDGGWRANEEQVRNVILEKGGMVTAWILTHYHPDHIGAFNAIYQDPQGIEIKLIYGPDYDVEWFESVAKEWDGIEEFNSFVTNTAGAGNVNYVERDSNLGYKDMQITFYNCLDSLLREQAPGDILNNISLVFKVKTAENSVLFCGDCHGNIMADFLIERYGQELKADYVQPGHHGTNSLPTRFYDLVQPDGVLFDAPEWLMTGEEYDAKDLAEYFQKQGIRCYDYRSTPNRVLLY